jgi:hypothetical protein
MFTVNKIHESLSNGMSRVTLNRDLYRLISDSSRISAQDRFLPVAEQRATPLKIVDTIRTKSGLIYKKFVVDGVEIFYRYDATSEYKADIVVKTADAEAHLVPFVSSIKAVDYDFSPIAA